MMGYDALMKDVKRRLTNANRQAALQIAEYLPPDATVTAEVTGDTTAYNPSRTLRVKTLLISVVITDILPEKAR